MKLSKLLLSLSVVASIFATTLTSPVIAQNTQVREVSNAHDYTVQWTNDDFGDYYKNIDFDSYSTLKTQLQTLNSTKRTKTFGYDNMWDYYDETDYHPNNKSQYVAFYKGTPASRNAMNKEHVWPKSHGSGGRTDKDIHMVRPTLSADNSSRGNSFYVEGMNHSSNGWDPKTAGMNEQYRGQAARIIFYCVIADSKLSLVDTNYSPTSNANPDYKMGKLSDLLRWNLQYAVDITELNRNNGAEDIQGNRNPFIDNPYLACAIWGNYNDTTRQICADYNVIVDPYTGGITLPDYPSGGGNTGDSGSTSVSWGTSSNPLTTNQALENMKNFADQETSQSSGFVKGVVTEVTEISSEYKNVTLTLDNKFVLYRLKTPNNTYDPSNPEVKVGDEVVASGTFKKYGTKFEMVDGSIVSVNSGGSSTPDQPINPPTPDQPINPPSSGDSDTVKDAVSIDFSNAGLSNIGYTDGVSWNIKGKEYFASHAYINGSDVRLGHNQVKSLDSKFGISGASGSYLEPKFDVENCKSVSLEVKAKYGTTSYKVLFKETNTSSYSIISEGSVNGPMTIKGELSSPKNGRFIIVIVGSKPRIQLGQFDIKVSEGQTVDLSTLNLSSSAYEENGKSYLRFKANFDKNYLTSATKIGILVFSKNQLGNNEISKLYASGNLSSFKNSISKYDYLDFDFTSSKVEKDGNYVYGAVISNVKGHEDYKFVAVSYAEINGKLYFTNQIVSSYDDCK